MTDPQTPTTTVYVIESSASWHADRECDVIDTAQLMGEPITETTPDAVTARRPCLVCATPPGTEWIVTPDNLPELWELIGPSKPHYAPAGPGQAIGVELDGLTVMAHKGVPRQVARFGDTVYINVAGPYIVRHATASAPSTVES